MKQIINLLHLIKYKVTLSVTFTTLTGYLIYTGELNFHIIYLFVSIFLLAGGSSALNECQESKYDAKMKRTMNRPIPRGLYTLPQAYILSTLLIAIGLLLLYLFFGSITALLGFFNVLWYNGLYTNLKRITAFAVVPGSLVGAVPVLMGWTAAGGFVFERTIIYIAFFLFIWQVPHFWLLMLKYSKEYEEAGFPTIRQKFQPQNLNRIILVWIMATSSISIIIPLFLVNISWIFFMTIFILNLIFVALYVKISFAEMSELSLKKSFISINVYMLLFMLLLITYHLI